MSDLSVLAIEPHRAESLRSRAAAALTGSAATQGATARAADALAVLHALASSPQTAAAMVGLHAGQQHAVGLLMLCPPARPQREVLARIGWDPAAQPADPRYLVSLMPAADEAPTPRGST